ncbi:MAG: thioredoxin domain-containing protein [Candidatus Fimenecus sp.]|nr:thioredoxin domain-containing protein [Candidatus Fimenecus sp.]
MIEGKVKIAKVNVNIDSSLAEKYEVIASPTILYFIDGKETDRTVGMLSKEEIIKKAGL